MNAMNMQPYPKAIAYVTRRIKNHASLDNIAVSTNGAIFSFEIGRTNSGEPISVRFSDERLDDFEVVLSKADTTDYGIRFKYFIEFTIIFALGKAELLPVTFKVSSLLLQENEERKKWWKDNYVGVAFEAKLARSLYGGLGRIKRFLEQGLADVTDKTSETADVEEDLERIRGLLDYYKAHDGSLDEAAASVQSLSMLKGAGLSEIIHLEKEIAGGHRPGFTVRAFQKTLLWIAENMRGEFFLEVPLPKWINDYVVSE